MIAVQGIANRLWRHPTSALKDIVRALKKMPLVFVLAYQDLKHRYRRSLIGPFWLTINMSVMIASIGLVFGQLFDSPMKEYLPFLTIGMIYWGFITSVLTEGSISFISSEAMIKQLSLPLFLHLLRPLIRNIFILCHHIIIFPLVFWAVGADLNMMPLMNLVGFLILVANLLWMSLLLGIICTRYRDLSQIIGNILQVFFFITPIMWLPTLLPDRIGLNFLEFNPFYHLIEMVRAPLLGVMPNALSFNVAIGMCIGGWFFALLVYARFKRMIAYWI